MKNDWTKDLAGMRNLKCVIAYDGTNFSGFQVQAKGERTVQGVLEETLTKLTGEKIRITAAGRTDAKAHAAGQVINFFTSSQIPVSRWAAAFNTNLPADLVVLEVTEAPPDFHARYWARKKTYRYRIHQSRWPDVFLRSYSYHFPFPLEIDRMRKAAGILVGKHDFCAFTATGGSSQTTVRNLYRLDLIKKAEEVHFFLEADGFLYKMARNIVGTLLLVGTGKIAPAEVGEVLLSKDRKNAGPTAPPHGLCLLHVEYGEGGSS